MMRAARWWQWCGIGAIVAALPSAIWRVVVGVGVALGTPESWRASQQLPGRGTAYVVALTCVQVAAALATLLLIVPGADRVPARSPIAAGRRFPTTVAVSVALAGALLVGTLCCVSILNWTRVDPFRDADTVTGWTVLCWACYSVTLAWPGLLVAAALGYAGSRSDQLPPSSHLHQQEGQ